VTFCSGENEQHTNSPELGLHSSVKEYLYARQELEQCFVFTPKWVQQNKKLGAKNFEMGSQHIYRMLQLIHMSEQSNQLWRAVIKGPVGVIEIRDLVWIVDRADILDLYYWESWGVLQGAYHCCFSIPGKVTLLPA
jgi:hypothetical protein